MCMHVVCIRFSIYCPDVVWPGSSEMRRQQHQFRTDLTIVLFTSLAGC